LSIDILRYHLTLRSGHRILVIPILQWRRISIIPPSRLTNSLLCVAICRRTCSSLRRHQESCLCQKTCEAQWMLSMGSVGDSLSSRTCPRFSQKMPVPFEQASMLCSTSPVVIQCVTR
ncbi:uncharacterized protein B0H18DRAFT_1047623, partial [Fomitopsis serialis]|uniref:uncharacterized protein n=1 Tax=Fomitopsis serialis TaxID=139415 RepID=UPI0020077B79